MGDIIRDWLRTRLGVIIDLSPDIFGHYASDGTLLAKVLHSYDVIDDNQLSTLLVTQDPALARVNLKSLRVWLRFVGVDCDNDAIEEISIGKGTSALRLFYKVFLSLENKDRLHFITLQKEREKYLPSSSKFDVTTVSEEPEIVKDLKEHPYAYPLRDKKSLIEWQRKKQAKLTVAEKKDFESSRASQKSEKSVDNKWKETSPPKDKNRDALMVQKTQRELDDFSRKHRVKESPRKIDDSCEEIGKRVSPRRSKSIKIDREAAVTYTNTLKKKRHQKNLAKNFKTNLQKNLLADLWKNVVDDQEREFDEVIAKKVLHQSQYEKQLVKQFCDARKEKTRMAGNREIVEKLLEETRENEMRMDQERTREVLVGEREEAEAEERRIAELERRIEEDSERKRQAKIRRFCEKTTQDLVDMAIIISDYKTSNDQSEPPESLWSEWKALFFKNQPIIDPNTPLMVKYDPEAEGFYPDIELEDATTRTEMLNLEDFRNYHDMEIPWKDFVPNVDDEVQKYLDLGRNVLGRIVHKILGARSSPNQLEYVECLLFPMKTRTAVIGLPDSVLYEPIQELLNNSKVRLIRIEEAINYCLRKYKEEMKDIAFIELDELTNTREESKASTVRSSETVRGKNGSKKKESGSKKFRSSSSIQKIGISKSGVDKTTQTPRAIPHEDLDPSLSDAAYIGKWTYEFLSLGEPLSDQLTAKIIVEYIRNLSNIEGFVLVNYPNTYSQMDSLELAINGQKSSQSRDENSTGSEESNSPRIIFECGENDSETLLRRSNLVPNPLKPEPSSRKTYFTTFVKVQEKPEGFDSEELWEVLLNDATPLDTFYVEQEIALSFYYTIFDIFTLKRLARILISGSNELIPRTSSYELFGESLRYFEDRDTDFTPRKAPVVKRLLRFKENDYYFSEGESSGQKMLQSGLFSLEDIDDRQTKNEEILPGNFDWPWANFPQTSECIESLANLWQNLENSYVETLKETFNLKRTNLSSIAPWKDFVRKNMREYIERPDMKQDLLHEFHRAFNDVDEDFRDNYEMKKELHCRIDDFQLKLWTICDTRRKEAETERKRFITDPSTTETMINLANIYIDLLQAEYHRCRDTLQFVQDYYAEMLQNSFTELPSTITLNKIELEKSPDPQEISSAASVPKKVTTKESTGLKTKASNPKTLQAPVASDLTRLREEMTRFLSDDRFDSAQLSCLQFVENNIQYVQNLVENLASSVLDNHRKEETSSKAVDQQDKKKSSKAISRSSKSEYEKKQLRDLALEWYYALMFEINSTRRRLRILESAAKSDLSSHGDGMKLIFSELEKSLVKRFEREIKSVNEMASVFRFAVEEATPIQEELLLDSDKFVVRSNVLMFPGKSSSKLTIREESSGSRFQMAQLERLVETFRRLAPMGNLSRRAFIYILQDIISCNESIENSFVPSSWLELRACDVTKLVNELFGKEDYVDWREFVIYAMEIHMPSVDEILEALKLFQSVDQNHEEFVSSEDFFSIKLWFEESNGVVEDSSSSRTILDEDFSQHFHWDGPMNGTFGEDDSCTQIKLRITSPKNLLHELFSFNCQKVHYIALLMAFCKDEKPSNGLAKALSLATGTKICADWEEGEKYLTQRFEDNRKFSSPDSSYRRQTMSQTPNDSSSNESTDQPSIIKINDLPFENRDVKADRSDGTLIVETARGLSDIIADKNGSESRKKDYPTAENEIVYWLNSDDCETVLAAMLPSCSHETDLFGSDKSLHENLEIIFRDARDEEIGGNGLILAHRFLHNDFVNKLISQTKRFTTVDLSVLIDKIVSGRMS